MKPMSIKNCFARQIRVRKVMTGHTLDGRVFVRSFDEHGELIHFDEDLQRGHGVEITFESEPSTE